MLASSPVAAVLAISLFGAACSPGGRTLALSRHSPDPVGKRNNLSFAANEEATVFPRRYDKITQPVKAEVHRTTAMRVLDETSRT